MQDFRDAHFTPAHRAIAFLSETLFRHFTYTAKRGIAQGMKRKGGLGFLPFGPDETLEVRFFRTLDLDGKVAYDIGAFEGLFTMFFARRASKVVTYEAHPANYQRCLTNVRLNGLSNARVLNLGISDRPGALELFSDPLMPGAATGNRLIRDQIIGSAARSRSVAVEMVTLDGQLERDDLPTPDFIKIDIEGMELAALKGMSKTLQSRKPDLYIEMHGAEIEDKWENTRNVVKLLESFGYRIWHVEREENLSSAHLGDSPPGHLYCTFSN